MKITLSGLETNNKGSELMLYAVLQEIERTFPEAKVYVPVNSIKQGLQYVKSGIKLYQKPIYFFQKVSELIHFKSLLIHLHIPTLWMEDIYAVSGTDYFIDGSGFHFGDQWQRHHYWERRLEKLWKANSKIGAKLVFLPQAFGPFNERYSRNHLSVMAKYANLICPREKKSYNYLKDSGVVDLKKIQLFPDFTSLVKGIIPQSYEHLKGAVCVIPNYRMIDKGITTIDNYISFIKSVIELAEKKGHRVFLLNHEGKKDEELIFKCKSLLKGRIEVVTGINALEVKGIISQSYLVITSRFHGAASALNTGVPCLATSWSHKYKELFNDYGLHDNILSTDDFNSSLLKIENYLEEKTNQEVRSLLLSKIPEIQELTRSLWKEVWKQE